MVWQKRGLVLFLAVVMVLSMLAGCTPDSSHSSGKDESLSDYMKRESPELYGYINGRLDALEGR